MSHRFEVIVGLITSALGVIGIAFAIFGPATFSYGSNWLTAGSASLWDEGLNTGAVIFLAVLLAASLAVTAGAYLRTLGVMAGGAALLWASTVVLFVAAVLTMPGSTTAIVPSALHTDTADSVGIGIYVIPVALMALVTAVISMVTPHAPGSPAALTPH